MQGSLSDRLLAAGDSELVDHFGNVPPAADAESTDDVILTGPYAGGTKGAGSRFDYWLPQDQGFGEVEAGPDMPEWLQSVVAGRPLSRP